MVEKPREVMFCIEKERDGKLNVFPIAKVTYATPMEQWVLAIPYRHNRMVRVPSLPRPILNKALAMGCKRWVLRYEPSAVCRSFPLDRVKTRGWWKKSGGHYEYFVPAEWFAETEFQHWDYVKTEEELQWEPEDSFPRDQEGNTIWPNQANGPTASPSPVNAAPVVVSTPPVSKIPDITVTTTPVEASAWLTEEPPAPKPAPAKKAVASPPAPVMVPVIVRIPVTDAPGALVASLEQSIALITERKVTLTILRSADHPVMGEMWIGVFKMTPGSGYGERLSPIIGGTPIEVAMSAALALGKAAGR